MWGWSSCAAKRPSSMHACQDPRAPKPPRHAYSRGGILSQHHLNALTPPIKVPTFRVSSGIFCVQYNTQNDTGDADAKFCTILLDATACCRKPSPLAAVSVQADCSRVLKEGNQSTAALSTLPAAEWQQQGVVGSAPDALGTGQTELIGNGACHGQSSWQALYWNLCALRSQTQRTT